MTTIQNLPEEILLMIFKDLSKDTLFYCQSVCRAWYALAHALVLENIKLYSVEDILRFIASIDCNPSPTYLKAVKSIQFDEVDYNGWTPVLNMEHLNKLICRFPHIQTIEMFDCLNLVNMFDDEFCKTVRKSCPQLNDFFAYSFAKSGTLDYYGCLSKVQRLLTKLYIERIGVAPPGFEDESIIQYISSFSRLRELSCHEITPSNLEAFLPVFIKLSHLEEFFLHASSEDNQGFAECYLTTLTKEEQAQLMKRLSSIKYFSWSRKFSFCENAVKFIAKYMIGLNKINIGCYLDKPSNNVRQRLYFDIILDFVRSVNDCSLQMSVSPTVLSDYLPIAIQRVFHQTVSEQKSNRVLRLKMVENDDYIDVASLNITTNQAEYKKEVSVMFRKIHSIKEVTGYLFKMNIKTEDVDKFWLTIAKKESPTSEARVTVDSYYGILKRLPALKQVTLDIPSSFIEKAPKEHIKLDQVESLTLKATPNGKLQTLMDSFSQDTFPNLKNLDLHFFCGTWKEPIGEFQLELGGYSLQKLTLDVTPLMTISERIFLDCAEYFVLQIEFLPNSTRRLYQVFTDLSSFDSINDVDLVDLHRGEDYFRVNITVTSLQCLELCAYKNNSPGDGYDYMEEPEEIYRTIVFNE